MLTRRTGAETSAVLLEDDEGAELVLEVDSSVGSGTNSPQRNNRSQHATIVLNMTCSSGTESQQATLASKHKKTVCLHLHATRQEIVEYGCEMVWTWTELCQMCLAEIHTVVLTHGRCQDSW